MNFPEPESWTQGTKNSLWDCHLMYCLAHFVEDQLAIAGVFDMTVRGQPRAIGLGLKNNKINNR